jgi:malate/lactate dehydrogenase
MQANTASAWCRRASRRSSCAMSTPSSRSAPTNPRYGVTLSLPAVVGRQGALRILEPALSVDESEAFARSADALRATLERSGNAAARQPSSGDAGSP